MNTKLKDLHVWSAPIVVLIFVVLLAVMYGWVGAMQGAVENNPEAPERPETRLVAGGPNGAGNATGGESLQIPTGIGNTQMNLLDVHHMSIPSGVGGQGGQIMLANTPRSAYLGADLGAVDRVTADFLGIPPDTGLWVRKVVPSSPADTAGLQANDVILRCDHRPVNSIDKMASIVSAKKPGDVVKLVVIDHSGRKKTMHAKLANGPTGLRTAAAARGTSAWLGADIQEIDQIMKVQLDLPDRRGVIITQVAVNSPAATAGLAAGDVIRRVGGVRIRSAKQLQSLLSGKTPGKQVEATVFRNGKNRSVRLILAALPAVSPESIPPIPPAETVVEGTWIGMDVVELSPQDVTGLKLPVGTRGILVEDVESPPATMVGFQSGDIITAISGTPTPDMKQFEEATNGQQGAVVDVIRGNQHLYITVPPPGYTRQGTPMTTGQGNLRQVAAGRQVPGLLALLTTGPDMNADVSGQGAVPPYVMLVNLHQNSFSAFGPTDAIQLGEIVEQNGVTALICSSVTAQTLSELSAHGVVVYSGAVGPVGGVIRLFQSGRLVSIR